MNKESLIYEQNVFATRYHGLIYSFLAANRLSIDEFYDVVVFSYLKSVRDYLEQDALKQYAFSTIAWKNMSQSLSDYKKRQRKKGNIEILSIHAPLHEGEAPLEETLVSGDTMMELEMKLLMEELSAQLSRQHLEIIYLKGSGYQLREIARRMHLSPGSVKKKLKQARTVLLALCNP